MKGYTIIELLIAMFIFSVVVVSAVGIMVSSVDVSRKSMATHDIENNSRAIFELAMKEIRTGYDFNVQQNGGKLSFVAVGTSATPGGSVDYKLKNGNFERNNEVLNDNDVVIDKLLFVSNKPGGGNGAIPDNIQPQITIFIEASSAKFTDVNSFVLQTTISSRRY